ncbi:MAG: HEAT repeat domain-containing protein [Myxococcales bacterium]
MPTSPSKAPPPPNFPTKPRRSALVFKVLLIGAAFIALLGGGILAVLATRREPPRLSIDELARERSKIQRLAAPEQLGAWRAWASRDDEPRLQQEAFANLAWARDSAGAPLLIKGLASPDHGVRTTAALALVDFGTLPEGGKDALLKALSESNATDKPQICWALAVFGEAKAFDAILDEYRAGHLSTLQHLDGFPAFDPDVLGRLIPLDQIDKLARDANPGMRQLVVATVARSEDPRWTDLLIRLVGDPDSSVARHAAGGLGRIGSEAALVPLLAALDRADDASRTQFLEALRDGVGGRGLVQALRSVRHQNRAVEKGRTRQIFDMLRELADPRAADALVAYLDTQTPSPHWKFEAAARLGEIGDMRAAVTLGWRLQHDPLKLYQPAEDPEFRRDDQERVTSARLLADLAVLYPEKRGELLRVAQQPAMRWVTEMPQPHANGLRFLTSAGSTEVIPRLMGWADPKAALPKEGDADIPTVWEPAQSALRYLGMARTPLAWSILERQMRRRDFKTDVSTESMARGGLTVLGMVLRGLALGSAEGFAQWGDPKATPLLIAQIEDPKEHEDSRLVACASLAWVASDAQILEVAQKLKGRTAFLRTCYLETLVRRSPVPAGVVPVLVELLGSAEADTRHQAARAIGLGGINRDQSQALLERMADANVKADAALAILLGGETEAARQALARYSEDPPEALDELKAIFQQTFAYWSHRNYDRGDLARWTENAEAIGHVRVRDGLQDWARAILSKSLQSVEHDNGPHSMTRVTLRGKLLRDARGANEVKRVNAIQILKFMKERGVLMALAGEPGALGSLASRALFEVVHPKAPPQSPPQPTNTTRGK